MKRLVTTFLIFAYSSIAAATEGTVIQMSKAVSAGHVIVKPSAQYDVDLNGYKVPEEAKLLIFHVLDSPKSHYYYQEIKHGTSVYKMNSQTLMATIGSPPFRGLRIDDGAFLIIGSEVDSGSINRGILYSNESIAVIVRD